jgi:hypothetical protein
MKTRHIEILPGLQAISETTKVRPVHVGRFVSLSTVSGQNRFHCIDKQVLSP